MKETTLLKMTLLALGKFPTVRTWRNNTGQAWMGAVMRVARPGSVHVNRGDVVIRNARPVQFGLKGSGDLIGLRAIVITPEMVGTVIGQFVSVETKTTKGKQSEQQENFERMVLTLGGVYVVARDPADAVRAIGGPK